MAGLRFGKKLADVGRNAAAHADVVGIPCCLLLHQGGHVMSKARRTHSYMKINQDRTTEDLRKEYLSKKARSPHKARASRRSFLGALVEDNNAIEFFNVIFKGAIVFVAIIYTFEHFAGL